MWCVADAWLHAPLLSDALALLAHTPLPAARPTASPQLGTVLLCRAVFRRLVPMQLTLAFLVVSQGLIAVSFLCWGAWLSNGGTARAAPNTMPASLRWPPCPQLPFSGQLCASTLHNPGAAEVIARLHHWATRLIAFVNPLAPLGSSFGGQSSAQVSGVC